MMSESPQPQPPNPSILNESLELLSNPPPSPTNEFGDFAIDSDEDETTPSDDPLLPSSPTDTITASSFDVVTTIGNESMRTLTTAASSFGNSERLETDVRRISIGEEGDGEVGVAGEGSGGGVEYVSANGEDPLSGGSGLMKESVPVTQDPLYSPPSGEQPPAQTNGQNQQQPPPQPQPPQPQTAPPFGVYNPQVHSTLPPQNRWGVLPRNPSVPLPSPLQPSPSSIPNHGIQGSTPQTNGTAVRSTLQNLSSSVQSAANSRTAQSFTSSISSFASMASRGIQDAVSTAQRVNSTVVYSGGEGGEVGGLGERVLGAVQGARRVQPVYGAGNGNGNVNGVNGNVNGVNGNVHGVNGKKKNVWTDMDNKKKTALISSAMGKLLPGERVTVFLPNLVNVRDSSHSHTQVGSDYFQSEDDDTQWCCAITYYRVIVFNYRKSDFEEVLLESPEEEGDVGKKGGKKGRSGEEMLESLISTASTSRQYQHLQSNYYYPSGVSSQGRRHHVIQMPLASIERVSRLKEKHTNKVKDATNELMTMGFGGQIGGYSFESGGPSSPTKNGYTAGAVGAGAPMPSASMPMNGIFIIGKDNGRTIQFSSFGNCSKALESLTTFAFPGGKNLGYLFAFESRRSEFMALVQQQKDAAAAASAEGANGEAKEGSSASPTPSKKVTLRATPRRYEPLIEYHRMGVLQPRRYSSAPLPNDSTRDGTFVNPAGTAPSVQEFPAPWRPILKANASYSLCPTYPAVMFGPNTVNEDTLDGLRLIRETALFRAGGRMQTLAWASCWDGASIWRCAQPKVGLQGNRSLADEVYVRRIGEAAALANGCASSYSNDGGGIKRPEIGFLRMLSGGLHDAELMLNENSGFGGAGGGNGVNNIQDCRVKVIDLRPKSAAMANRTAGYGYENTSHYKNMSLSFHGIGNIHAVRDAYQKVSHLCTSPSTADVNWGQLVEDTKWLSHLRTILSSAWQVAFHVRFNRLPVLIHCSHGWDRTSQVCALAQLFLDPYYRTRVGFSCLVEKEFMALGHPFHTRCGHGEGRGENGSMGGQGGGGGGGAGEPGQMSPIFIQFLDCVYQIVHQYPDYFEFNTKYLLLLSEHVYSCRFGTLLCDSEKERETVASIRQRTPCLWEYLDSFPDLINRYWNKKGKEMMASSGGGMKDGDLSNKAAMDECSGMLMMPLPTLLRNVTLWSDRHCMHGPKPMQRCLPMDALVRDNEHPLLEKNDLNGYILENALKEASKWKKVAEEREKELEILREKTKTTTATAALESVDVADGNDD